jgi:signal transduction histidine kinase
MDSSLGSIRRGRPGTGFLGTGIFRSARRRIVGGVAGGLGEFLGVDPVVVRIGFVLLTLCGLVGPILYAAAWAALPEDDGTMIVQEQSPTRSAAAGMMILGILILFRQSGLWLGDALASSLALVALGFVVIWFHGDDGQRQRWSRLAERMPDDPLVALLNGRGAKLRLALGALLLVGGVATFLAGTDLLHNAPGIVTAVGVTVCGATLIFGPWGYRLARQLADERRERIRSEERADLAAHLHDSVLQTLALIQRTDQPKEMVALARSQERELRAWLSGSRPSETDTLSGAIEASASAVELKFKVPVDVVKVGDAQVDDRIQVILDACGEAMVNAAKHSGTDRISVFVEVEPDKITAFVRDQGAGFDQGRVAGDRRGISESIRGRMERSGGSASIVTEPGSGTEVQLTMGRSR